jgi:fumarate reductase iron-sulfur subunit
MSETKLELEILRYDPEKDQEPYFQTYPVTCQDDWMVLDAINYIKDHVDPTISYRWSCHMAVCGSCAMMIDGEPKLACKTPVRDYVNQTARIEPLANFPIERDLVVDISDFMGKLKRVKPYIIRKEEREIEEGEHKQSPAELVKYRQFTLCINCLCCYAACPQYALIPEFIGPAALTMAHRYNQDSRDQGLADRQDVVAMPEGVWDCSFAGECSEVCPKHVDPAGALQQLKIATTIQWYKGLIGLGGK